METITNILLALVIALAILGAVIGIPYAVIMAITARMRRRALERLVVGEIALVMREHLPLSVGLSLGAASESHRAGRRLEALSHYLSRGLSLSQSIRAGFPECPGLVLSLIRAGEDCQQLPAAVEQAEKLLEERDRTRGEIMPSALTYVCLMSAGIAGMLTILLIVIAPKFEELYLDFGVGGPPRGMVLFNPSTSTALLLTFCVSLVTLVVAFTLRLRPRRTPIPSAITRFADTIRWWSPGLRQLEKGHGLAVMLRAMRHAVRSGMDVGQAALLASKLDVNCVLRERMRGFASAISRGAAPHEAAMNARFGDITALALQGGVRGRNMDAALRYAADYNDAVVSRFWSLASKLAWPLATIGAGILVCFTALELMIPMIALLNAIMYGTGLG